MRISPRLKTCSCAPDRPSTTLTPSLAFVHSLFTTSMHQSISKPLRDGCSKTRPHPFPALVANLSHALSSLRVYGVRRATSVFWRGVQNLDLRDEFKERGVRYRPSEQSPLSMRRHSRPDSLGRERSLRR